MLTAPIAPPAPAAAPVVPTPAPTPPPPAPEPVVTPTPAPTPTPEAPVKAAKSDFVKMAMEKAKALPKDGEAPKVVDTPPPAAPTPEPAKEPPKAADVKPAATPDDSDAAIQKEIDVKTKGMDGASKKAFADLRYEQREMRRQLKDMVPAKDLSELQKQLDEAKKAPAAAPVDNDKVTALEARLAEYEADLTVAKVEKTDAFKNAVTVPMDAIEKKVSKLAAKANTTPEALMKALTDGTDSRSDLLVEAAANMNKVDEAEFYALAPKLDEINEKATTLRSNAKEALDKMIAKTSGETAAQQQQAKQAREAAFASNLARYEEALPSVFKPLEGTDEATVAWNDSIAQSKTFAQTLDYGALPPEVQSEVAIRAAAYPQLVGLTQSLDTQLEAERTAHEATRAELAKFAERKPGGGTDLEVGGVTDPAPGEKDIIKRLAKTLAAKGG